MGKYRLYTDQDVINYSKEVHSIAGLLRRLDLRPTGGNYANIKRILSRLKVNTEHWTGAAWSRGAKLKDWSKYTRAVHSKPHLIKVRGHKCEQCNLAKWNEKDIPLEIHHKDGDRTNNEFDNLELVCCNCHALTPGWRRRKS